MAVAQIGNKWATKNCKKSKKIEKISKNLASGHQEKMKKILGKFDEDFMPLLQQIVKM